MIKDSACRRIDARLCISVACAEKFDDSNRQNALAVQNAALVTVSEIIVCLIEVITCNYQANIFEAVLLKVAVIPVDALAVDR
jgi:hypothetical protein